jgi:hypothetical protein
VLSTPTSRGCPVSRLFKTPFRQFRTVAEVVVHRLREVVGSWPAQSSSGTGHLPTHVCRGRLALINWVFRCIIAG